MKREQENKEIRFKRRASSALTAQIKKVAPNLSNRDGSYKPKNLTEVNQRRRSSQLPPDFDKNVTFADNVQLMDSSEDIFEVPLQSTGDDDDEIKDLTVPLGIKRFRMSIAVPQQRPSCIERMKKWFGRAPKRLSGYYTKLQWWNEEIKVIEGQFGTSVVSYFLFIRFLLFMNFIIFLLSFCFVVLPQIAFKELNPNMDDKIKYNSSVFANFSSQDQDIELTMGISADNTEDYHEHETGNSTKKMSFRFLKTLYQGHTSSLTNKTRKRRASIDVISFCHAKYRFQSRSSLRKGIVVNMQNILQGTGFMVDSLMFIGYYSRDVVTLHGWIYHMPLAFVCVSITTFIISLIFMIRFSSLGVVETYLSDQKFEDRPFEMFAFWDYCINTEHCALLQNKRFVNQIQSNLAETHFIAQDRKKSTFMWIKLYLTRFFINIVVLLIILSCYTTIYKVAFFQLKELKSKRLDVPGLYTLGIEYLSPFTISFIQQVSSFFFGTLIKFENYRKETEVNISLFRNVFLSLSSVIVLVSSLYQLITCSPRGLCGAGQSNECRTPRCWETYLGQQLYKLGVIEMFFVLVGFLTVDIPRSFFYKRYKNKLAKVIGRSEFSLNAEVLQPICSQTICWLGVFYSPLLPIISMFNLIARFYIKKATVMKYSAQGTAFKASRFNSTFILTMMVSFFAVVVVQSNALFSIHPSLGCSPFRYYGSMIQPLLDIVDYWSDDFVAFVRFIFSGWFFIPASGLLCISIYHYWTYITFLKMQAADLKAELIVQGEDRRYLLGRLKTMEEEGH